MSFSVPGKISLGGDKSAAQSDFYNPVNAYFEPVYWKSSAPKSTMDLAIMGGLMIGGVALAKFLKVL